MKTLIVKPTKDNIKKAGKIIKQGGLVVFPTETVYGLGANALDSKAVAKIFKAKNRPSDNPLIVHVCDKKDLWKYGKNVPEVASPLVKKFWPGPLSLIVLRQDSIPGIVSAGLMNVAIRMPNNRICLDLIEEAGAPIAAPSANSFSKPSPTKALHVYEDLKNKITMIIDGGQTDIGLESTVLDLTQKIPMILRPGKISIEEIEKVIGKIKLHPMIKKANIKAGLVKSPGMKYRHYSPKAKVVLIKSNDWGKILKYILKIQKQGKNITIVDFDKNKKYYHNCLFLSAGNTLESFANKMFDYFRVCDKNHMDVILIRGVEKQGIGVAIMNRLEKAMIGEI
jgi:L-threonylcarbamoyladenylate synthase